MRIFYCWQSDRPTDRSFIEDALRRAAKAVASDDSLSVEPVVDRDTRGLPGSPDITASIFERIRRATAVVADLSIVHRIENRAFCNPNVVLETGYAIGAIGPERVIMVMNSESGEPTELPFDVRHRRVLTYHLSQDDDRATVRRQLVALLEHAIRLIIESHTGTSTPPHLRTIEVAINESMDNVQRWLPLISSRRLGISFQLLNPPHLAPPLLDAALADAARISTELYTSLAAARRNLADLEELLAGRSSNELQWLGQGSGAAYARDAEIALGEASRLLGQLKTAG